ncbi:MAG: hypothetical protein M3R57_08570 [Chloroflexota bacterium]|nr:hypothetical protein [Chloroflexota bacterium]
MRRPFDAPVDAQPRTPQASQPAPETLVASSHPVSPPVTTVPLLPVERIADRPVTAPATVQPMPEPRPLNGNGGIPVNGAHGGEGATSAATAPQFRRFIKSRAYVPMHELRRRFGINGMEDDVTPVQLDKGWIYVGLPPREGQLLGELLRGGEVGFELSLDPCTPIVIGVYPMRPVPRH